VFSIGILELVVIFTVILLVVGPEKLPQIARTLAKYLGDFRRVSDDLKRTVMSVGDDISPTKGNDPNLVKRLGHGLLQQFEKEDENDKNKSSDSIKMNE